MEFLVQGQFPIVQQSYDNGVTTEYDDISNISEIIYAPNLEQARDIAENIFARYTSNGHIVTNRRVFESQRFAPNKPAQKMPNPGRVSEAPAIETRKKCRCKKCGDVGFAGEYPFSTLPASAQLCDDCGA